MTKSEIEPYENLANAIVEQAVIDYEKALIDLLWDPKDYKANLMKEDCEAFFLEDIGCYTSIDGEVIINEIRRKVQNERKRVPVRRKFVGRTDKLKARI